MMARQMVPVIILLAVALVSGGQAHAQVFTSLSTDAYADGTFWADDGIGADDTGGYSNTGGGTSSASASGSDQAVDGSESIEGESWVSAASSSTTMTAETRLNLDENFTSSWEDVDGWVEGSSSTTAYLGSTGGTLSIEVSITAASERTDGYCSVYTGSGMWCDVFVLKGEVTAFFDDGSTAVYSIACDGTPVTISVGWVDAYDEVSFDAGTAMFHTDEPYSPCGSGSWESVNFYELHLN